MGGGDLNLKKSWHPSTLKNIERVWKAEQKHTAEQKKIEQLQKELQDERGREEIRQFAEDKGVIEKKSSRLDWMYAGPAAMVERDEYLLGRQVDKTFEVMDSHAQGLMDKSIDDVHQPGATFRSNTNVSVDLASKVQQDPLFSIKKKEQQAKKDILMNPVKMKQLQQYLEKTVKKSHKKKNKKKKSKKSYSSNESDSFSDKNDKRISKKDKKSKNSHRLSDDSSSGRNYTKKTNKHRKPHCSSNDSDSDRNHKKITKKSRESHRSSDDSDRSDKKAPKKFRKSHRSSDDSDKNSKMSRNSSRDRSKKIHDSKRREKSKDEKQSHRHLFEDKHSHIDSQDSESSANEHFNKSFRKKAHKRETDTHNNRFSDDDYKPKKYGLIGGKRKREDSPPGRIDYRKLKIEKPKVYKPEPRKKRSAEEIDRCRKEMMENAKWRDDQRSKSVKQYREEVAKEVENHLSSKGAKFITPMLSEIAECGSVEARIKSNKYNIQRSGTELNKNFAKRMV